MAPSKSRAQALLEEADKKESGSSRGGFLGFLSASGSRFEEAGDLYENAANAFKLDKDFGQAGKAFVKAAECREKSDAKHDAANAWLNASKAFKAGADNEQAIYCLKKTVQYNAEGGRFRQAADRMKELGAIYKDMGLIKDACSSLEGAADWYHQEGAESTAMSVRRDAADLQAELGDYNAAIELYRRVAMVMLESPLTKYSVKEIWLKQCLCALANDDMVAAKLMLEDEFRKADPTFSTTREARFLTDLVQSVEEQDVEAYATVVQEFDRITRLDKWKTEVLLKIKKSLEEDDDLK
ncbi:vesicular-fusion protein SEC17 [Schizopora paradoxa]|uniref:Vesicular-fusion protein SEC17 n=1 Tax=Schizopora paradoxa TaxID=27342 RepID=A0A0H2RZ72_9AGAM|nr:vesicular-fusion protein SEC17 [Schizopora paradoxa]